MSTLTPYTGEWTSAQASFLLGRTTFSRTKSQVDKVVSNGLQNTLDDLFNIQSIPDPPIHHKFQDDPLAPVGTTWVDKYYPTNDIPGLQNSRRRSVAIWAMGILQESKYSLMGKMMLFWHEHFAINDINRAEYNYQYLVKILENYLGNFRTLVEEMTISPAMLKFLNGNQNTKESPNENYARELLELFMIGVGDAVGEGDYTNYTEKDVVEIARALTGWRFAVLETGYSIGFFVPNRHDTGTKQLSHRFDNIIINNEDDNEYKTIIDIILQKEEVARHLCRKLHIWFVGSDINDTVEENIIQPMAKIMFDAGFDVAPSLRALLESEYFLDGTHAGCMLSSPIDHLYKLVNNFEIPFPSSLIDKYFLWEAIGTASAQQEMAILNIPSVAGWKAYYQSPNFYQYWINSVSLGNREQIAGAVVIGFDAGDVRFEIDVLKLAANIDNATEPAILIDGLSDLLFEMQLGQNQKDYLKNVLIPGLPDFEWTVEYGAYLADPDDPNKKNAIEAKLKILVFTMINMPEFYLM